MKIAIIGSGISGISAAWLLNEHSEHDVTLYEKNEKFGGHTNTVNFSRPAALSNEDEEPEKVSDIPVDTGFIVFNELNYPNFINFLNQLQVAYIPSEMTFSVSKDGGLFEWAGSNLLTLFCQPSNLLSLKFYRMIYDILRFNLLAPRFLTLDPKTDPRSGWSIGQYLKENSYSKGFVEDYLAPMSAAIWSSPPDTCLEEFPAGTLIQFMCNHCLLQVEGRPQWQTIKNGSQSYLQKVLDKLDSKKVECGVKSVKPINYEEGEEELTRVEVEDINGSIEVYDHVILATHGDEALELLGENAAPNEKFLLKRVKFSKNKAILHTDQTLMPIRKRAWSSWNYLGFSKPTQNLGSKDVNNRSNEENQICLTYWMNLLQSIDSKKYGDIFVTLNPTLPPRPETVVKEIEYSHPIYSSELIETQRHLHTIQNIPSRHLQFCGAWTNYGFHEDGFLSGVKAAIALGAQSPFPIIDEPAKVVPPKNPGLMMWLLIWIFYFLDKAIVSMLVPTATILGIESG